MRDALNTDIYIGKTIHDKVSATLSPYYKETVPLHNKFSIKLWVTYLTKVTYISIAAYMGKEDSCVNSSYPSTRLG